MLAIDANRAMMIIFGIENRRPAAVVTDVFVEILNRSSGGPTNAVDEYSVDPSPSILNGFVFASEKLQQKTSLWYVQRHNNSEHILQII